ncbi:hypothetical protein A8C32_04265 [Flavivirga aquatica]|uniref:Tetratricopeptide repeat protein n=1 Tax=Flavivirga aquatica TaxID=1849968 RepID=A0A1E5SH31_9FLAO|nr:hypothetical protein [Flavivirga aquatica]OEJ98435.1 hypothetical protein A8C32_04265 [Flavivirga aquatica]
MKKQIIIALALSMSAFSFAQKKELKAVEKALKNSNYGAAKEGIKLVDQMLESLDEKTKSKYYYLKAEALYANGKGKFNEIGESIKLINKIEGSYKADANKLRLVMFNNYVSKGNKTYENKNYNASSFHFERAYNLRKTDTIFLYYAAATAVNVKKYDRALKLYNKLKNIGYTGIERQYFATEKATNKEVILDKATRNLYVKAGTHINPGERLTESKKPEIVKNIALIHIGNGNNEKAIAAMKDARAENPNDVNLIISEANIHLKMDNKKRFGELMEEATKLEPNNAELQYNLGVISSESDVVLAKKYYNRAIELDPNYTNAYINLSVLVLGEEKPIIEEMNNLGSSRADNKRYDELREKRQALYRDAIPYLTKALEIDSKSINAAKTLMSIYSILGETDKHKEMKAKVAEIEGEQ